MYEKYAQLARAYGARRFDVSGLLERQRLPSQHSGGADAPVYSQDYDNLPQTLTNHADHGKQDYERNRRIVRFVGGRPSLGLRLRCPGRNSALQSSHLGYFLEFATDSIGEGTMLKIRELVKVLAAAAFLCAACAGDTNEDFDILIENGQVVDGTGDHQFRCIE